MDLAQGVEQDQQVDDAEDRERLPDGGDLDAQAVVRLRRDQAHHAQLRRLGQQDPQQQPRRKREARQEHGLPDHHARQVALAHAQDVVQAELPLSPADQEGICVEQEDQREDRDDERAQHQDRLHDLPAAEGEEDLVVRQERDDVVHRGHADAGQQIRQVELAVLRDAGPGQAAVQAPHRRSPPSSGAPVVVSSVSAWEIFS